LCQAGVNLPWETTDQYIRSGHRSPEEFQSNSLRTIILSEDEGIKAIAGKPIQRYIKRQVERDIFAVVLAQAGISPLEAQVRLN